MASLPINSEGLGPWIPMFPEFIGFGSMDRQFAYELAGFGATDANFPYEFIGLGDVNS